MANDITSIHSSRTQQSGTRQSQRLDKADSKESSNTSTSSRVSSDAADKVSLTSTATRLKDIEHRLTSESPMDDNRIKRVKSAISNGEYDVNPDRVAHKMINLEDSLHS